MDLYFEMYSGIAGDMTIGALLDLGASKEKLIEAIDSLGIDGYELVFERVKKSGIDAYNFDVKLEHGYESHHGHEHVHGHDHVDSHENHHNHEHVHSHKHNDMHLGQEHNHRNLQDIIHIIDNSSISDWSKNEARKIFNIIADAEAEAHGIDKNEVHFHEVGAVDSIIDIVGVCVLLDDLQVENIYFTDLYEGRGLQKCAHGHMPIPVPAVLNIIKNSNIEMKIIDEEGEHVTPTGAAIVRNFNKGLKLESLLPEKVGIGAGNKNFTKSTNVLRIMEVSNSKKKSYN